MRSYSAGSSCAARRSTSCMTCDTGTSPANRDGQKNCLTTCLTTSGAKLNYQKSGISAVGSAGGLGPSGREFESPISDQQRNLFLIYIKDRFLSALFFVFTRNSKSRGLYQVLLPVHKFKSTYPWLLHDAL